MTAPQLIANALVPIGLVNLVGSLARGSGLIKAENGSALVTLALNFCLPALLFNSISMAPVAELLNWRLFLGLH